MPFLFIHVHLLLAPLHYLLPQTVTILYIPKAQYKFNKNWQGIKAPNIAFSQRYYRANIQKKKNASQFLGRRKNRVINRSNIELSSLIYRKLLAFPAILDRINIEPVQ
jgi:hypothetical protein